MGNPGRSFAIAETARSACRKDTGQVTASQLGSSTVPHNRGHDHFFPLSTSHAACKLRSPSTSAQNAQGPTADSQHRAVHAWTKQGAMSFAQRQQLGNTIRRLKASLMVPTRTHHWSDSVARNTAVGCAALVPNCRPRRVVVVPDPHQPRHLHASATNMSCVNRLEYCGISAYSALRLGIVL
jgi:hypothetical protein